MKWINPEGYDLVKDIEKSTIWKAIYEFKLDPAKPLTLVDDDGLQYQPNRNFFTDLASIPRILQLIVPRDRFLAPMLHDSNYQMMGVYVNGKFTPLSRSQADDLLLRGMLCDPIPPVRAIAYAVWGAVRCCGWMFWGKRTELPPDPPMRFPVALT